MIDIIFENENFVVCEKPACVLSVPAREKNDVRPCLGRMLREKYNKNIFPVHRLDYEVSGLIVYAKNEQAHKVSQEWFLKKLISKKYVAKTSLQNFSHWPTTIQTDKSMIIAKPAMEFFWRTQIQRGKKRSFESAHGEWAETKALIKEVTESEIHWELFPLTGKPHQLRLELSRHGFPIHRDQLYGSAIKKSDSAGIALKAVQLNLANIPQRLGLPEIIDSTYQIEVL